MAMPKSVTKINKDGVQFISNVDRVQYTMKELERAALRDTAKFIRKQMKELVPVYRGVLKSNIASWLKKSKDTGDVTLHVGIYSPKIAKQKGKIPAYHTHLLEFGTVKMRPQPFLRPATYNNIQMIREIQGKYLSYIEDEEKAKGVIDETEDISDD